VDDDARDADGHRDADARPDAAGREDHGTYEGRYGKFALTGTVKKNVIEFSFTMERRRHGRGDGVQGQVAADFKSMKGDADMGGMGEVAWSAAPQKKV
jgi:hypothetical protein